jgi:hypothetical protein
VSARAAIGIWHQRGGVLLAAAASLAIAGYVAFASPGTTAFSAASRTGAGGTGDCADTAMAAIADKTSSAAQRAYQCMDASFQQRVTEQAFVQQIQSQGLANVNTVARVSDYHTPTGGTMVYYALNANGQSAGYIVYLGQNGKVLKIE